MAGVYIKPRDLEALERLWRELAEFPASQGETALAHCLERLTRIVGACNASWLAATRDPDAGPQHPLQGWWPRDIVVLHEPEEYARRNQDTLEQFEADAVDPQSAAMVAQTGRTRTLLRAAVVDDAAWERTRLYQHILRPIGITDRLVGSYPVTPTAESYFALDRGSQDRPFDERESTLLRLFLSGCPHFHDEQLRGRGLLGASGRLSPREQSVLKLLLTDLSERGIAEALGLTFNTTHQYVVSVYHKLGVHSRAELTAWWLRHRLPTAGHSDERGPGPLE